MFDKLLKPRDQDPDDIKRVTLEADGWQRAGREATHYDKFDGTLFRRTQVTTTDEIAAHYLQEYGGRGFTEVRLEKIHVRRDSTWVENDHEYYVYLRHGSR